MAIKTGVELSLRDEFSAKMKVAAGSATTFSDKTVGALNKVDRALSGTAAKLGALGVSLSVGAAAKNVIQLDHRLTRIGLTANASAEQVSELKKQIYETAMSPDIKLDTQGITDAVDVILTKTGNLQFAEDNIRNIGLAIQATGESGESIGGALSAFADLGYSAEEITQVLNEMSAISDKGAFTLGAFAGKAPAIVAAYSQVGTSVGDISNAMKALQIMLKGIGNVDETVTALRGTLTEFNTKRAELAKLGIDVWDEDAGKLRDINDVMMEISADIDKRGGDAKAYFDILGESTMKTILAYRSFGADMQKEFAKITSTEGAVAAKSQTMAKTMQSNLTALSTASKKFADTNLAPVIGQLADGLNKLSENPEQVEKIFKTITMGLGAVAAVKGVSAIATTITSLSSAFKTFKSSFDVKDVNINEALSITGNGNGAMPVYVTNMNEGSLGGFGGMGTTTGTAGTASGARPSGLLDANGRPISSTTTTPGVTPTTPKIAPKPLTRGQKFGSGAKAGMKAGAGMAGAAAVMVAGAEAMDAFITVNQINASEMSDDEKTVAKGETIGGAVGSTAGTLGGGIAGAALFGALGTLIAPGIGTAIGAQVGSAIGSWVGNKLGGFIGEKSGGAIADSFTEETQSEFLDKKARAYLQNDSMNRQYWDGYDPSEYITAHPSVLTEADAMQMAQRDWLAAHPMPQTQIPASVVPPQLMRPESQTPFVLPEQKPTVIETSVTFKDDRTEVVSRSPQGAKATQYNTGNRGEAR